MRKLFLSLLLTFSFVFSVTAKDSVYLTVLKEHVVQMENEETFCTAFKVTKDEFLTAAHCFREQTGFRLYDHFGVGYLPEVEKLNAAIDLALLKANVPTKTPIKFAQKVEIGKPAIAVGYVFVFDQVAPMFVQANVIGTGQLLIAVDQPYRKGFSGGPLVNAKGELIGVNVMTDNGVGFSVSLDAINYFLHGE